MATALATLRAGATALLTPSASAPTLPTGSSRGGRDEEAAAARRRLRYELDPLPATTALAAVAALGAPKVHLAVSAEISDRQRVAQHSLAGKSTAATLGVPDKSRITTRRAVHGDAGVPASLAPPGAPSPLRTAGTSVDTPYAYTASYLSVVPDALRRVIKQPDGAPPVGHHAPPSLAPVTGTSARAAAATHRVVTAEVATQTDPVAPPAAAPVPVLVPPLAVGAKPTRLSIGGASMSPPLVAVPLVLTVAEDGDGGGGGGDGGGSASPAAPAGGAGDTVHVNVAGGGHGEAGSADGAIGLAGGAGASADDSASGSGDSGSADSGSSRIRIDLHAANAGGGSTPIGARTPPPRADAAPALPSVAAATAAARTALLRAGIALEVPPSAVSRATSYLPPPPRSLAGGGSIVGPLASFASDTSDGAGEDAAAAAALRDENAKLREALTAAEVAAGALRLDMQTLHSQVEWRDTLLDQVKAAYHRDVFAIREHLYRLSGKLLAAERRAVSRSAAARRVSAIASAADALAASRRSSTAGSGQRPDTSGSTGGGGGGSLPSLLPAANTMMGMAATLAAPSVLTQLERAVHGRTGAVVPLADAPPSLEAAIHPALLPTDDEVASLWAPATMMPVETTASLRDLMQLFGMHSVITALDKSEVDRLRKVELEHRQLVAKYDALARSSQALVERHAMLTDSSAQLAGRLDDMENTRRRVLSDNERLRARLEEADKWGVMATANIEALNDRLKAAQAEILALQYKRGGPGSSPPTIGVTEAGHSSGAGGGGAGGGGLASPKPHGGRRSSTAGGGRRLSVHVAGGSGGGDGSAAPQSPGGGAMRAPPPTTRRAPPPPPRTSVPAAPPRTPGPRAGMTSTRGSVVGGAHATTAAAAAAATAATAATGATTTSGAARRQQHSAPPSPAAPPLHAGAHGARRGSFFADDEVGFTATNSGRGRGSIASSAGGGASAPWPA